MIEALLVVGLTFFNPQVPPDSIGTETINGKVFVIHRVEEKETLYGISKRYGSSIDDILTYNTQADAGLAIGQILKIPYTPRRKVAQTSNGSVHRVQEGETLYSISRLYNVSVDELKTWNALSSNSISMGQELIVRKTAGTVPGAQTKSNSTPGPSAQKGVHTVAASETLYSISRQYGVAVSDLKKWNGLESNDLKVGQALNVASPVSPGVAPPARNPVVVATPAEKPATQNAPATQPVTTSAPTVASTSTITISENVTNSDEVRQSGVAELIDGTEGNRKYLALHRTAPIGTILKVRNEMNSREVFVRVIGKLPDSALTENLVIKISRSAYDRLGAIDPRFRVEVTYYK